MYYLSFNTCANWLYCHKNNIIFGMYQIWYIDILITEWLHLSYNNVQKYFVYVGIWQKQCNFIVNESCCIWDIIFYVYYITMYLYLFYIYNNI